MKPDSPAARPPYSCGYHFLALLIGAVLGGLLAAAAGFSSNSTIGAVFTGALLGELAGIFFNAASGRRAPFLKR